MDGILEVAVVHVLTLLDVLFRSSRDTNLMKKTQLLRDEGSVSLNNTPPIF